ncbi:alpha-N-arabinofuranosidase [Pullulanibacillus sp. KACC 23026]|uniref:alpha-N-arabinofuranosidase n=1 Tax=Pullulanibacillus sp. KACC 23026 TaxID=3028315 RepID=UPI0023AF2028|nr:alpha-N-arabinofuranosidase [Pullulanibacillus sp. KACC 23026]WEG11889.1 alpha-N-arabinofuranosidase [Pullulanibacillus sp. KACC 23026]
MVLTLTTDKKGSKISKYIYGQFAEHLGRCIYDGVYVGENSDIPNVNGMRTDVIEALKAVQVPLVRWPGGCFADEYHWKDGVGPKEARKKMINTHWGGVTEDNSFGTHEFFEMLRQIGADAYVNGNVGSGTVEEMQEWVDYMTMPGESPMANFRRENGHDEPFKVAFFGVGNENWGCGGNMRPEYYADLYRRYQTYVRQYGEEKIYKIACGPSVDDYNWMEVLMANAARYMDGISLHHYTIPTGNWQDKGNATGFPESEWVSTMERAQYMDELITKHSHIMDKYDPEKRVGLIVDEWGIWVNVEPGTNPGFLFQQNTIRDAMVAAITFNIFHKHADRVYMANIAQMINVLQAMILTEGDKMVVTPTYHVFDLYKNHQDAESIEIYGEHSDSITCTASKKAGLTTLSICNFSTDQKEELEFKLTEGQFSSLEGQYIAGEKMDSHNSFDEPDVIKIKEFTSYKEVDGKLVVSVPAMSVVTMTFKN